MKELLRFIGKENRTALLLVLVAVVGILIFILTSATFPFKDLLFDKLFPKPPSKAAPANTFVPVVPQLPPNGTGRIN